MMLFLWIIGGIVWLGIGYLTAHLFEVKEGDKPWLWIPILVLLGPITFIGLMVIAPILVLIAAYRVAEIIAMMLFGGRK